MWSPKVLWEREIRRAVLYGQKISGEVAQDIEIFELCLATHSLPESGGVLDQDPNWIYKMLSYLKAKQLAEDMHRRRKPKGGPVNQGDSPSRDTG